jgi:hypothetical protein
VKRSGRITESGDVRPQCRGLTRTVEAQRSILIRMTRHGRRRFE